MSSIGPNKSARPLGLSRLYELNHISRLRVLTAEQLIGWAGLFIYFYAAELKTLDTEGYCIRANLFVHTIQHVCIASHLIGLSKFLGNG